MREPVMWNLIVRQSAGLLSCAKKCCGASAISLVNAFTDAFFGRVDIQSNMYADNSQVSLSGMNADRMQNTCTIDAHR